ncbi:unnamed protein product [Linum trigynum]|uniref:Uncharacterized protein n=1 Tax=Linum trigynum TaxID=586398 RepID=A0AAV2ECE6_9ROSI
MSSNSPNIGWFRYEISASIIQFQLEPSRRRRRNRRCYASSLRRLLLNDTSRQSMDEGESRDLEVRR